MGDVRTLDQHEQRARELANKMIGSARKITEADRAGGSITPGIAALTGSMLALADELLWQTESRARWMVALEIATPQKASGSNGPYPTAADQLRMLDDQKGGGG